MAMPIGVSATLRDSTRAEVAVSTCWPDPRRCTAVRCDHGLNPSLPSALAGTRTRALGERVVGGVYASPLHLLIDGRLAEFQLAGASHPFETLGGLQVYCERPNRN